MPEWLPFLKTAATGVIVATTIHKYTSIHYFISFIIHFSSFFIPVLIRPIYYIIITIEWTTLNSFHLLHTSILLYTINNKNAALSSLMYSYIRNISKNTHAYLNGIILTSKSKAQRSLLFFSFFISSFFKVYFHHLWEGKLRVDQWPSYFFPSKFK